MKNNKRALVLMAVALLSYAAINLSSAMEQMAEAVSMTETLEEKIEEAEMENEELNEALSTVKSGDVLSSSAEETSAEIVFIDIG